MEEDDKGLKFKISKKAYVFDITRRFSNVKRFSKAKPQEGAGSPMQALSGFLGKGGKDRKSVV